MILNFKTILNKIAPPKYNWEQYGIVQSVKDGIARVDGLNNSLAGEMVYLNEKHLIKGMILSLEYTSVSVVIFGNDSFIKQNDFVFRSFLIMNLNLNINLFGRVIDSLGNTIDGGPVLSSKFKRKIDTKAVGIIPRQSIKEPMQTGICAVDSITPIGCGQRELIIGDRQTGKTTITLDAIINQKQNGHLYCIYVAIGQKKSTVAQIVTLFKKIKIMHNIILVSATSSEPATLQFLAPYSGCALGE